MRSLTSLIIASLLVTAVGHSNAEDVNAIAFINGKLAALRDFNLADKCNTVKTGTRRERFRAHSSNTDVQEANDWGTEVDVYEKKCVRQVGKLSALTLHFESFAFQDIKFVQNALPTTVNGETLVAINCDPNDQQNTTVFRDNQRHSTSLTTTHGVTNTVEANTKVAFNYAKAVGGEFGLRDSYQVSTTTSQQTVDEHSSSVERSDPVIFPKMARSFVEAYNFTNNDRINWSASVVLDGPVVTNKDNIKNVSELLSQGERTLKIGGYLDNVQTTALARSYLSKEITASECKELFDKKAPLQYILNYLMTEPAPDEHKDK
jgi:Clostridium epsilon toxin ETX/Bacillus mosquitocidal toxin MTX2